MPEKNSLTTAPSLLTTGIGSLPHRSVEAGIAYSFQHDIPFFPQLPQCRPNEFMIPQALAGLPGLTVETNGSVVLNFAEWAAGSPDLQRRLDSEQDFSPPATHALAWLPFLAALSAHKTKRAKIQIVGAFTALCSLYLKGETTHEQSLVLSRQIHQLIRRRGMAMIRALKKIGVTPLIFIDEPAWFAVKPSDQSARTALEEMVLAFRNEGAEVGLHCCSDADWVSLLSLPVNWLSIDVQLSLNSLLACAESLAEFRKRGDGLSLGIIPTQASSPQENIPDRVPLAAQLSSLALDRPTLLTSACGLAFNSIAEAEAILERLTDYSRGN